jgi:serine/threonine-protein kinase
MMQMGKYQLIRRLGRGGMAEVYLAKAAGPMGFEKTLVVKRILPHLVEEQQFIEMFLSEARLAAQLNHANVVQIFDFGEEGGSYFIAMEYIDGPSLHALIKRAHAEGTLLPFPLCAKIVSFACEGLAYAHELADPDTGHPLGLIHRDISADNILLSRNGGVKVVDFGIAKAANQKHRTQTGIVKGKVAYMSPEHLKGQPLDPRADVFALGVVLYELVTGEQPFEGESDVTLIQAILNEPMVAVSERRKDVPKELERIIEKALAKDREQRYRSCRELQAEIERFLLRYGEPVGSAQLAELVRSLTPPEPAGSPVRATPLPQQPSMAAPITTVPGTEVLASVERTAAAPVSQTAAAPVDDSSVSATTVVAAGPHRRPGRVAGLLLLIILAGGGGYLGLRGVRQKPEQKEDLARVAPELPQSPPTGTREAVPEAPKVPAAPVAQAQEPAAEESPAATPLPREETPALASFRVVSKPGGMVSINGKRMGRSPLVVEVKPGKVTVAVQGDDEGERFDTSQAVVVKPGVNPPVSLEPKRLKVTVRGRPRDFKVQSLDIHYLGGSAGPIEVYEGWHTLKLSDPAGKSYTAECQARVGDELCLFEVKVNEGG